MITSGHSLSVWARVGTIGAVGIAMIGLVDFVGAPTGAEPADASAEPVSVESDGAPLVGTSTHPSVSDDGSIVVFSQVVPPTDEGAEEVHSIIVRNRTTLRTTRLDAGLTATAATVSGDGCSIAYSAVTTPTDGADGGLDDGGVDGGGVDGGGVDGGEGGIAAGAGEGDAVGDGAEAGAEEGAGEGEALQAARVVELRIVDVCVADGLEPVVAVLDTVVGEAALPAPAVSQDGLVTVWPVNDHLRRYSDGVDEPPFEAISSGIDGHVVGPNLDMSADGAVVVFESGPAPTDDPIEPFSPTPSSVWVSTGGNPSQMRLAPAEGGSSWPTISADGNLVIYQSDDPSLFTDAPETGTYLVLADVTAIPAVQRVLTTNASHPDVTGDGAMVVYDTPGSEGLPGAVRVRRSDTETAFDESTEKVASAAVSGFGESVSASVSRPVLSSNGELVLFDSIAGVDLIVDETKAAQFAADAHVWARATSTIFEPIPDPTTTTSSVATTIPETTLPIGTAPVTTATPRTTTRNTTRNTTRTTTRQTTRPATTTTTVVPIPAVFEPAAFEFAPTIVAAGRRIADVELVNPSAVSVSVDQVRLDPANASGFAIVDTTCVGTLPAASRCVVNLEFAPDSIGEMTANLVADLGDGSTITSALRGVGAPEPLLTVLPGVASNGQVVTVFGSGFPAGLTVQFSWNDGRIERDIETDDVGGFAETLVVLPNTTGGPVELRVAGQTDQFGDVVMTMLVSNSTGRSGPAVLGGGIGSGVGL